MYRRMCCRKPLVLKQLYKDFMFENSKVKTYLLTFIVKQICFATKVIIYYYLLV